MILINPDLLAIPAARRTEMENLTAELIAKQPAERSAFINSNANRDKSWGHLDVLTALRAIAGNKCWYSEVQLDGADPNVDHFRPKGRVREVDANFNQIGDPIAGYWWLAFDPLNYRLAAMHANQRRTDETTAGGKSDYFPVRGARAAAETAWDAIVEDALALDPCSPTDVRLLWFDLDAKPCASDWKRKPTAGDAERVKATIWLYHLDKQELQKSRTAHVQEVQKDLLKADANYKIWARDSANPNLQAKQSFDEKIAEIKTKTADRAVFAGAKRCSIRTALAKYSWIDEFLLD